MRRPRGFGRIFRRPNRPAGHLWIYWYFRGDHYESVAKALGKPHDQVTEKDAERLLNHRVRQKARGEVPATNRVTVGELLDAYWTHLRIKGVKNERQTRTHIMAARRWFGSEPAARLDAKRLQDLVSDLLSRTYVRHKTRVPYARGTIKTRLYVLRAALVHAHETLQKIPTVPRFPKLIVRNARKGFFTRDAFTRIHHLLAEPADDIALFGYLTGWRKGEVLELPLTALDLSGGTLRLDDSKTDEGRVRPIIEPELRALLEQRWAKRAIGCPYLFHRAGRKVTANWFDRQWRSARAQAGLPERLFHDFRRTAYNDIVSEAGVDLITAMELTGHKSLSVAQRYNIVEPQRMRLALQRVAAMREAQKFPDKSLATGRTIPLKGQSS